MQRWADDRYLIDTPERVHLEYEIAGLGSRFLAALIDSIVLGFATGVVMFAAVVGFAIAFRFVERAAGRDFNNTAPFVLIAIAIVLSFVVLWGYYVFFEMIWQGQSPGKRAIGLRVIQEGGYPLGFTSSAIRNVIRIIDLMPSYYILGALVMFVDSRSRRLGDLAAGTVVVRERGDLSLAALDRTYTAFISPDRQHSADAGAPIPYLERLTSRDYSLLREYLHRRASLDVHAAYQLADRLATAFAEKLEYDRSAEAATTFLERLAIQSRITA